MAGGIKLQWTDRNF